jgi:hypothetical protein
MAQPTSLLTKSHDVCWKARSCTSPSLKKAWKSHPNGRACNRPQPSQQLCLRLRQLPLPCSAAAKPLQENSWRIGKDGVGVRGHIVVGATHTARRYLHYSWPTGFGSSGRRALYDLCYSKRPCACILEFRARRGAHRDRERTAVKVWLVVSVYGCTAFSRCM